MSERCSHMFPSAKGAPHRCRNKGRYMRGGKPYCLLHDPSKQTRTEARHSACVAAFHDPTRTMATEDISERLFWRVYDALQALRHDAVVMTSNHHPNSSARLAVERADALLQSLNIKEREG